MASLSQILSTRFVGKLWSCTDHADKTAAYATLNWSDASPKPTLAALLAEEANANADLASAALKRRQIDLLLLELDAFLTAFDIIGDALAELATKSQMKSGQTLDPTVVSRVQAFRTKVAAAKAIT